MYKLIKMLCSKCKNYFEDSQNSCLSIISSKDKLSLLLKPTTTIEVKITRQIKNFCKINQNRFWTLYYRISEKRIYFSCSRCNKSDLCREYILNRVIKHIKSFNQKQESNVFREVRLNLIDNKEIELDKKSKEVALYYSKKILNEYSKKDFDFESGSAIVENVILERDREINSLVNRRLNRYRLYRAKIILKDFLYEALNSDKLLKKPILLELLFKEKFINYINKIINSRFIDFVRSKPYLNEIEETETTPIENPKLDSDIESILNSLPSEDRVVYKLKYGIKLDSREFLNITYKLNYSNNNLINRFTNEERFYIKLSIQYSIDDSSQHLNMIDVKKVKESISKKISTYRETMQSSSYIEGRDEIFIKLIYSEPLKAKEIGEILNLTSKQIDKRVENIKKRLKKL